ncbi:MULTISPECIES: hypothetical protein [Sulfurimonas]|uniref:hypothetical protein n=1 Tax=Sulfurimonas TaxID=202746 RepID=UPI00126428F9|nr:hypothetical protein [Sulfurimonas indica]
MQYLEALKLHTDIFVLEKVNKEFIAIASHLKNIKIASIEPLKIEQNIYFELLEAKTTALTFHPSLPLMAIANGEILYILDINKRNILQTIITHDGVIEKLSFMQNEPYLISGTQNGRVIQYRYEDKIHIARLCSFPYTSVTYKKSLNNNYVSAIAYNAEYIAASGYGGAVTLVKFHSQTRKFSFESSKTKVNAITFTEDKHIIFANVDGMLFMAKIRKNAHITQVNTHTRDILQLLKVPQSNYLLIIAKSSNIMLFDIRAKKIIKRNFLSFDANVRTALLLSKDILLVTLADNSVHKIYLGSQKVLRELLEKRELLEIFKLVESNPMLEKTPEAQEAEKLYKKLYSKVLLELITSKKEELLDRLKPFEVVKSKKESIKNLLLAYENYPKLQSFYSEHKYALAYALCEKFPALQLTPPYKKMESTYTKSFTLAQKQLLLQRPGQAKALLEPFATISSKRAMTQLLLRQNKEFLAFIKAIGDKNYEEVDRLVKTSPVFQEIPSYKALLEETDKHIEDIYKLIADAKLTEAVEMIKKLQHISVLKENLYKLYNLTQEAKKLLNYYEKNNFVKCYETLDDNSELESMQLAQLLEDHWKKRIKKCELFALEGNFKAVKETLGELIHINTRREKIGDLLRVSFHAKIKKELDRPNYKSAENIIYSYIDIFGMDSEVKQLMRSFEKTSHTKLAITFMQKKHKDRNAWTLSDIMN